MITSSYCIITEYLIAYYDLMCGRMSSCDLAIGRETVYKYKFCFLNDKQRTVCKLSIENNDQ